MERPSFASASTQHNRGLNSDQHIHGIWDLKPERQFAAHLDGYFEAHVRHDPFDPPAAASSHSDKILTSDRDFDLDT